MAPTSGIGWCLEMRRGFRHGFAFRDVLWLRGSGLALSVWFVPSGKHCECRNAR